MTPYCCFAQTHPRLVVAVGDGLYLGALCREACRRMIIADELWMCAQLINVVDMLCRRGRSLL